MGLLSLVLRKTSDGFPLGDEEQVSASAKKVAVTFFTHSIVFISLVFLISNYGDITWLSETPPLLWLCTGSSLYPIVILLASWKHSRLARSVLLVAVNLNTLLWALLFGRESGLHHLNFPTVLLPVILFEKHRRKEVAFLTPLPFLGYFLSEFLLGSLPFAETAPRAAWFLCLFSALSSCFLATFFVVLLQSQYEEQLDVLRRMSEAKAEFLQSMSHEIRTPMSSIIGLTDLLLHSRFNKDQELLRFLKTIHSSGEALLAVVDDILDLAKIEAGKFSLNNASVCLRDFLEVTLSPQNAKQQQKQTKTSSFHSPGCGFAVCSQCRQKRAGFDPGGRTDHF